VGINFGWVLPDAQAYAAGDHSLECVIYAPKTSAGSAAQRAGLLTGDARLLATHATLPALRHCQTWGGDAKGLLTVPCSKPHGEEVLTYFMAHLAVPVGDMTDAQWAPLDKVCQSLMDILIGAPRKDLTPLTDSGPGGKAGDLVYISCNARRPAGANGARAPLPAGTVVGLGSRPLGS
jgi:hypothetical protein